MNDQPDPSDEPTGCFCGLCHPCVQPVALDPQRGYLCPIHGDGLDDTQEHP